MKPFFTLLIGNNLKTLSTKYESSSIDKLKTSLKKDFNNAILYYRSASNIAMTVDLFEINPKSNHFFFGFGTMVSKDYGILGNDFKEIMPKILLKSIDIKSEFVNGGYAGIEISNDEIEVFNDFFGLSTIFYCQIDKGQFIVSNSFEEVYKVVVQNRKVEWNLEALNEYLSLGKNISGNTLIDGIKIMLPARSLSFKDGNLSIMVYRQFPDDSSRDIDFNSLVDESLNEFKESVKRIYNPKYKYCFSISGGTDSRLVYFEWPDRQKLLTETYGDENNSDTLKAKRLVKEFGNIKLHEMEQDSAEKFADGLFKYFDHIDYPIMAYDDNYYHLDWKVSRKANIRFGGTDGELLGGENMYLSRKPAYVLKEGFFSYPYNRLDSKDIKTKEELISNVVYRNYKKRLVELLPESYKKTNFFNSIIEKWDTYLGVCNSQEVYVERYRTWHTIVEHNYHFQNFYLDSASQMTPFQDYVLSTKISETNPKHRELRKLEIAVLKKYNMGEDIAIDTTHLLPKRPYYLHKFFRMLRFAMNIGYSMKVPFIQKGTPLKTTIPAFYQEHNKEFREKVLSKIKESELLDREKLNDYLEPFYTIEKYNHFKATHDGWPNLFVLFKLAMFEERLKKLQ